MINKGLENEIKLIKIFGNLFKGGKINIHKNYIKF